MKALAWWSLCYWCSSADTMAP